MTRITLLAAAAVGLGLALPGGAQASGPADTWQFRCPAAGTTVEQSSGTTLRYRAEAPNNPASCILAAGQRRFMGYWTVSEALYRAGGERIADALAKGIHLDTVPSVTFDYFATSRTQDSIHVQETWRAQDGGRITTPAGSFETVRVDRSFSVLGSNFQYTQSVWFDRAGGTPVTARIEHRNPFQAPSLVNWVANDITRPQAAR